MDGIVQWFTYSAIRMALSNLFQATFGMSNGRENVRAKENEAMNNEMTRIVRFFSFFFFLSSI